MIRVNYDKYCEYYVLTKQELDFYYQIGYSKLQYILDNFTTTVTTLEKADNKNTYELSYKELMLHCYNDDLDSEEPELTIFQKIARRCCL